MSKEIEHYGTDTVICPYCGYDNGGEDGDGPASGEQQCYNDDCNKYFTCEPSFTVDYSTYKLDCRNGSEHRWAEPYFGDSDRGIKSCKDCFKGEWVNK